MTKCMTCDDEATWTTGPVALKNIKEGEMLVFCKGGKGMRQGNTFWLQLNHEHVWKCKCGAEKHEGGVSSGRRRKDEE